MFSVETRLKQLWLNFAFLICAGVVAVLIVVSPPKLLPFALGVSIAAGAFVVILLRPMWLLYLVVLSALLSGFLRNVDRINLGDSNFSVSGLRSLFITVMILFILGRYLKNMLIPKYYLPFLAFAGWTLIRWVAAGGSMGGLKDVILYSLPPLIGLFTIFILTRFNPEGVHQLQSVIMYSVFAVAGMYIVLISSGLIEITVNGPKGIINPRPVASFLLVVISLGLAQWSYPRSRNELRVARVVVFVGLGLILFTLSRMALGVGLLLCTISMIKPMTVTRVIASGVIGILLLSSLFYSVPALRARLFNKEPKNIEEMFTYLRTSGRNKMWPVLLENSYRRPIVGWGPGSARPLVALQMTNLDMKEYPPHNEYLQIWHDLGIIGIILLLWGWVPLCLRFAKRWTEEHMAHNSNLARLHMAATLASVLILFNAIVDNTFHYLSVMGPAFIIFGIVHVVTESDKTPYEHSEISRAGHSP